jgi:hypothetical protein
MWIEDRRVDSLQGPRSTDRQSTVKVPQLTVEEG